MEHYNKLSLGHGKDKRPTSPFLPVKIQKDARISPPLAEHDDGVVFGQFVSIEDYKGGRRRRSV